jgi:hypothetical protein
VYAKVVDLSYQMRAEAIARAEAMDASILLAQARSAETAEATDAVRNYVMAEIEVRTGRRMTLEEQLAEIDVSLPANFIMGLGDSLTFGLSRYYRNWQGAGGVAQVHSRAYFAGEVASFALGVGRLAYMGVAKALPRFFPGAADDLARALAMSAARDELKSLFRFGLPVTPIDLGKYSGSAAQIAAAASRTNLGFNVAGAAATAGAGVNHALLP